MQDIEDDEGFTVVPRAEADKIIAMTIFGLNLLSIGVQGNVEITAENIRPVEFDFADEEAVLTWFETMTALSNDDRVPVLTLPQRRSVVITFRYHGYTEMYAKESRFGALIYNALEDIELHGKIDLLFIPRTRDFRRK